MAEGARSTQLGAREGVEAKASAKSRGPWPLSATFGPQGLEVGGVATGDLAERYGTPLLVVDEEDLRARCRTLRSLFPRVLYAAKAFTSHAILRIATEEGLGLLVATEGELEACLRAGIAARHVVLHGNNKSDRELSLAVSAGCDLVIADNADELVRLDRIAREHGLVQDVLLRVIPEVQAGAHPAIETGTAGSKFGTPLARAKEAVGLAGSLPGLRFAGLHAHIGSQVLRPDPYLEAVGTLLDLLAELERSLGVRAEILDVGGGFGVTYTEEVPAAFGELSSALMEAVRAGCERRGLAMPALVVEPGRSLVANAVLTLYRTGQTKEVAGGPRLLAVDGGMSDNIRPMLYGSRFTVAIASPPSASAGRNVATTIVGRHCESGDVLAERVELPERVGPGTLLAFAATGAYTYSMASNYNRIGRPAVAAVGDGRSELWLRREDASDLDRLEVAVPARPRASMPPEGVFVRPARAGDATGFVRMWRAVVAEQRFVRSDAASLSVRACRRRFRRSWTDAEAHIVAVERGGVIGHCSVQRESHPVSRHVATLGIAVAADRRGRGIGSMLLAEALRWAEGVGVEKVVLSVYPHNAAAIALYRRFGFREEGRLTGQSRKSYGYEDEILMAVWLGERTR